MITIGRDHICGQNLGVGARSKDQGIQSLLARIVALIPMGCSHISSGWSDVSGSERRATLGHEYPVNPETLKGLAYSQRRQVISQSLSSVIVHIIYSITTGR